MPATTTPPASPDRPDPSFWGDERRRPRAARIPRPSVDGIEALRDRVQAWRGDSRAAVVVLVVVAVVAGVVWYRIGAAGGEAPPTRTRSAAVTTTPGPAPADDATGASATNGSRAKLVIVHVAGAVTRPGVLELAAGARVIDAVEGAGGALPEAHLDQLNLAAKVADGERVYVPRIGELSITPADGGAPTGDPGAGNGLLNLNTATQAQLEELPGIGPVLATAVLEERERRGGFRSVNELRDVRGIGEKRFEDLRDQVTV